ncbi:MAG: hypothetical protein P9M06_04950 [Candidatus Saelkia tenebricola]|nr:hypothetical protein [Candidatus Saelkia tenebricola]
MDRTKHVIIVVIVIVFSLFTINSYFAIKYLRALGKSRWPEGAIRTNATTGYNMSPSFSSTMLDKSFSICSHELGYRIPMFANNSSIEQGGILSVGCSFTYGDRVEAEQTFTYLTAEKLHMPSYNYGVCSYSYASVILQLNELRQREILDKLKPKILILGAGNWLVKRSLIPFFPTSNDSMHVYSYITKMGGRIQVSKPPKIHRIKYHPVLYEDYSMNKRRNIILVFKRFYYMSCIVPGILYVKVIKKKYDKKEIINSFELYDFVIAEINKIIQDYGMKFIILWMPYNEEDLLDKRLKRAVEKHKDIILVNGFDAIRKYNVASEEYVNTHPGFQAHDAYAKEIILRVMNNGN